MHKNHAVNLHLIMNNRQERLICFLVVWFTMFSCTFVCAQNPYQQGIKKDFSGVRLPGSGKEIKPNDAGNYGPLPFFWQSVTAQRGQEGLNRVPSDIFYRQSGIMCKMEWQLEKASHIPFRFRLGSLSDCNALEGKH